MVDTYVAYSLSLVAFAIISHQICPLFPLYTGSASLRASPWIDTATFM